MGPYGFTLERNGILVESRLNLTSRVPILRTNPRTKLNSSALQRDIRQPAEANSAPPVEVLYTPGGYTNRGAQGRFLEELKSPERLIENAWR